VVLDLDTKIDHNDLNNAGDVRLNDYVGSKRPNTILHSPGHHTTGMVSQIGSKKNFSK